MSVISREKIRIPILIVAIAALAQGGCIHVKMDPVKIDATVTIRVERELENFFDDLDSKSSTFNLEKDAIEPTTKAEPTSRETL